MNLFYSKTHYAIRESGEEFVSCDLVGAENKAGAIKKVLVLYGNYADINSLEIEELPEETLDRIKQALGGTSLLRVKSGCECE